MTDFSGLHMLLLFRRRRLREVRLLVITKKPPRVPRSGYRRSANNIVPAAAIQGVFKPSYIVEAQETPVVFFWGHRLTDLKEFIEKTK